MEKLDIVKDIQKFYTCSCQLTAVGSRVACMHYKEMSFDVINFVAISKDIMWKLTFLAVNFKYKDFLLCDEP